MSDTQKTYTITVTVTFRAGCDDGPIRLAGHLGATVKEYLADVSVPAETKVIVTDRVAS